MGHGQGLIGKWLGRRLQVSEKIDSSVDRIHRPVYRHTFGYPRVESFPFWFWNHHLEGRQRRP